MTIKLIYCLYYKTSQSEHIICPHLSSSPHLSPENLLSNSPVSSLQLSVSPLAVPACPMAPASPSHEVPDHEAGHGTRLRPAARVTEQRHKICGVTMVL